MATTSTESTSIFSSTGSQPSMFSAGVGAVAGAYSAYKSFTGPDINYDILKLKENQKELDAQNEKLKVEQQANMLREQFSEAAGSFTHGAARRGIKATEGSAAQNIEQSAKAVGEDTKTMKGNAKFKIDQLRAEADRIGQFADGAKEVEGYERIGKLGESVSKLSRLNFKKKGAK